MFGMLGTVGKLLVSRWTWIAAAAATALGYSESVKAEQSGVPNGGDFKRTVEGTAKWAFDKSAEVVTNVAVGLTGSTGAKDAVRGASELTATGLNTAGGLLGQLPEAGAAAGQKLSEGAAAGHSTLEGFFKSIVPKGWEGWAATAAIAVGGLFGLKSGVLGSGAANFANGILGAPMSAATALLGFAGTVLTPFAYVGAALGVGWLLLSKNGQQLMSDAYHGVRDLFPGGEKKPEQPHSHSAPQQGQGTAPSAPPQPAYQPEAPLPAMAGLDVNSVRLNGVQGGSDVGVNDLPTRSRLQDDLAQNPNPRRDPKNSPNYAMSS